jgi:phytoene dehydrogenase-like protein
MGTRERYDAVVIGAGPSGLAAGLRLALFEKRVVVLERHALWGGLNSFYKRAGRRIDTGLHALTNFVPRGVRNTPLPKLLRQLRIGWDELALAEQSFSEIAFPDVRLAFTNRFEHFEAEIARAFPAERDGFARLVRAIREATPFDVTEPARSARAELARHLRDPLLVEMLMLPMLWYGGPREHDLEWSEFVILWRSILEEGLARPRGGIKRVLDLLVARLREAGGELRTRAGVARIVTEDGAARGVVLDDGSELEAEHVLSSAGWPETLGMCGRPVEPRTLGRISFAESITFLDRLHTELGHHATITFFNDSETVDYRRPEALVDARSGVICCGDNYAASPGEAREGIQRVTVLANHDRWSALAEPEYLAAKERADLEMLASSSRFVPDPRPHAVYRDMFTPRTIAKYTSHLGGCVYGSPEKRRDGRTGIANLSLIGTDHGLCGIVGTLLSGVIVANEHVLASGAGAGRAHA